MSVVDRGSRYCIVGAGSSGLTVAKNLRDAAIECDIIEREDDIGGNWYYGKSCSSVYRSTHLISSKPLTEYRDFPMPDDYPDYPNHQQVLAYLRNYARQFGLYPLILFNTAVERIEPASSSWDVTLSNGETRRYRGVVIANGHLWDPKYPDYPGQFAGVSLHSHDYKTAAVLRDKRVLVVGAGNSGCDIAVESAMNAAKTFHSVRRGYHYMPKYFMGMPSDQMGEILLRWGAPLWLRRAVAAMLAKMILGWPQDYGLKKPDHKLFESHPIVNSQMLYYVGHGDIVPKPDVKALAGDRVRFSDGSEESIDVIVYCTGFNIRFPFIDHQYLNWQNGKPHLYLNVFHPTFDNLVVAGLIQPDSGQFGLVEWQARLIAAFVAAQSRNPRRAETFKRKKARPDSAAHNRIHYLNSARHLLEVEHYSYRRQLKKLVATLSESR